MKNVLLPVLSVSALVLSACADVAPMKQKADAFKAGEQPPPQVVAAPPPLPTLLLIAPTELRAEPVIPPGCWAKFFDEPDFRGRDSLTVAGPVMLPDIHSPAGGVYWPHRVASILVGPRARVTAFSARNFQNPLPTLNPGSEQTRLEGALSSAMSIASLKLECS